MAKDRIVDRRDLPPPPESLQYGQYYIVLLLVFVASLLLYVRKRGYWQASCLELLPV